MAELKTKPTEIRVEEFLEGIADTQRRQDCTTIVTLMQEATGAEPKMWGPSIVGFGDYHYKYASGREGDWFQVGFSPRKQNLTLYILSPAPECEALLQQLGKHKQSGSCLHIKALNAVDIEILKALIQLAVHRHQVPTSC